MIDTIRSERIKLTSTRGTWIGVILFVVLSLALTVLSVVTTARSEGAVVDNNLSLSSVVGLGTVVLAVMGALSVTGEFRHRTIYPTFQATPHRVRVMLAKAVTVGVVTAVLGLVVGVVSLLIGRLLGGDGPTNLVDLSGAGFALLALVLTCATGALGAMGVGAVLRSTPAAISLIIVWMALLENILSALPTVGEKVGPFMPFMNAYYAVTGTQVRSFHWGQTGALVYFIAVALVLFALGTVSMVRRNP